MDWGYQGKIDRIFTGATPPLEVDWDRIDARSALIRQRHGPCFGTCPVFALSIWGDGRVEYYGANFVRACGYRQKRISVAAARGLLDDARAKGFFWRDTSGSGEKCKWWTDSKSIVTRVDIPGYGRAIRHYLGATCFSEPLEEFERSVLRVTDVDRWIGEGKTAGWCESDNNVD